MAELDGSFRQLICDLSLFPVQEDWRNGDLNAVLAGFSGGAAYFEQYLFSGNMHSAETLKALYDGRSQTLILVLRQLVNHETGAMMNFDRFIYRLKVSSDMMAFALRQHHELEDIRLCGLVEHSAVMNTIVLSAVKDEVVPDPGFTVMFMR